jgi:hypothetical protein
MTGDRFERTAAYLLNGCRLAVAGQPHGPVEIGFSYHGDGHLDVLSATGASWPFTTRPV